MDKTQYNTLRETLRGPRSSGGARATIRVVALADSARWRFGPGSAHGPGDGR
jgi:hypothetical protein